MCARLEDETFFDDPEGYRLAKENNAEALATPVTPLEHIAFVARRWVEMMRGANETSQIASLIELLKVEATPAPVTPPGRDEVLEEVRVMLEEQRKECLEAVKHTALNAIRADELDTALINLRALAAAKEPR